jgi:hypothetical protein
MGDGGHERGEAREGSWAHITRALGYQDKDFDTEVILEATVAE